jgi:hypothetical protein
MKLGPARCIRALIYVNTNGVASRIVFDGVASQYLEVCLAIAAIAAIAAVGTVTPSGVWAKLAITVGARTGSIPIITFAGTVIVGTAEASLPAGMA